MERVLADADGTDTTSAHPALHGIEGRTFAVQVERHVQRLRAGMIGHRPQALQAARAGAKTDGHADALNHVRTVGHATRAGVDFDERLVAGVGRYGEGAGRQVQLPQNAELAHREQRAPAIVVDQDALERFVHVVRLAGQMLEVPLDLACGRVERERRVRVERVATCAAGGLRPGLGLGGAPVDRLGHWVVGAGHPGIAPGAERHRQVAPGVAAGLPRPGNRGGLPQQAAGPTVNPCDVARLVVELGTPRQAADHDAVGHHRSAREREPGSGGAADVGVPADGARTSVEADQVRVGRGQYDDVVQDGQAAGLRRQTPAFVHGAPILPQQLTIARVERIDDVAGVGQIHDPVVHERRGLRGTRLERPRPRQLQRAHIGGRDLIERAVAPAVQRAAPVQPVRRIGVREHRIGHVSQHGHGAGRDDLRSDRSRVRGRLSPHAARWRTGTLSTGQGPQVVRDVGHVSVRDITR